MKRPGLAATSDPFVLLDFPRVDKEDSQRRVCSYVKQETVNQRVPLVALTIVGRGIKSSQSKEIFSFSIRCDEGKSAKRYGGGKKLEAERKCALAPLF